MITANKMKFLIIGLVLIAIFTMLGYGIGLHVGEQTPSFTPQQLEWLQEKTIEGEYSHEWWAARPELCEGKGYSVTINNTRYVNYIGSVEHHKEWLEYYQMIGIMLEGVK